MTTEQQLFSDEQLNSMTIEELTTLETTVEELLTMIQTTEQIESVESQLNYVNHQVALGEASMKDLKSTALEWFVITPSYEGNFKSYVKMMFPELDLRKKESWHEIAATLFWATE